MVTNYVTTTQLFVTRLATCLALKAPHEANIVGRRMRLLRTGLGWPQERIGVAIGIEESSARARISRYELGVHEPPLPTVKLLAAALGVPLAYLYCEDDGVAELLLQLHRLDAGEREARISAFLATLP